MAEASRSGRTARLTDVAQAAGVGVDRVQGPERRPGRLDTARDPAAILDAARELNYRPNAMARGRLLAR